MLPSLTQTLANSISLTFFTTSTLRQKPHLHLSLPPSPPPHTHTHTASILPLPVQYTVVGEAPGWEGASPSSAGHRSAYQTSTVREQKTELKVGNSDCVCGVAKKSEGW